MTRIALASLLVSISLGALGCSPREAPPPEPVNAAESPIYDGSPETTHQAIIALFGNVQGGQFECTGTVLQVVNNRGYVLTAGHCCPAGTPPLVVLQGNDYQQANRQYNVVTNTVTLDPKYVPGQEQNGHDFCMFQFSGADANTPTLPAVSGADGLNVGSSIDIVGYGVTNGMANNSVRNHIVKNINQLDSLLIEYDQPPGTGGACEGDSGGPALATVGGQLVVVGVTSFGDQNCTQYGVSGRVQGAYASFIGPYLNGQQPMNDCPTCANASIVAGGQCHMAYQNCLNDPQCSSLNNCVAGCGGTQSCVNNCEAQYPKGLPKYNLIGSCICKISCQTECAAACMQSPATSSSTTSTTTTGTMASTGTDMSSTGTDMSGAGGAGGGGSGGAPGTTSGGNNADGSNDESSSCAVRDGSRDETSAAALVGMALALVVVRRRRRFL